MSEREEQWRFLEWDGYEVSDRGRVRHCGRILKPVLKKATGYFVVTIGRMPRVQISVHRLVLLAFRGAPRRGFQGCHENGIRTDNRLENLRWDSVMGNQHDKKKHGTLTRGEKHPNSKLTAEDVMEILASPKTQAALAGTYGVTQVRISQIRRRVAWAHII